MTRIISEQSLPMEVLHGFHLFLLTSGNRVELIGVK